MADDTKIDNTKADKPPAKKTTAAKTTKGTADSQAVSNKASAKPTTKPAAKSKTKTASKVKPKEKTADKLNTETTLKAATAATAKAGALNEGDMSTAAKKISELDKKAADDAIRSKKAGSKKPANDLKARAHEAKQRAQKKILEKAYVSDKPTDPLERLANTFDSSAKRWEMVVYPSLFAFVLLAGYGFFLIYRLTHDIAILSQSVTHMAVIVSDSMPRMT